MLLKHLPALRQLKSNGSISTIILASGSPRRKEILGVLFAEPDLASPSMFQVVVSNFEENLPHSTFAHPGEYALATARGKAKDVLASMAKKDDKCMVIAADTVVFCKNEILEKPANVEDAKRMLRMLSGTEHITCTGVVVMLHGEEKFAFFETTKVRFVEMDEDTIAAYVDSKEPFGKAGGYAVQGIARSLVDRVEGCFYNIAGFPPAAFAKRMGDLIDELVGEGMKKKKRVKEAA
jgi:septum formation protein